MVEIAQAPPGIRYGADKDNPAGLGDANAVAETATGRIGLKHGMDLALLYQKRAGLCREHGTLSEGGVAVRFLDGGGPVGAQGEDAVRISLADHGALCGFAAKAAGSPASFQVRVARAR